ncbi:MAG: amidase domain-containing protein [Clostridia bacterium]|nr:amidase domain-containing protein [Clostridia bacterium]
MKEYDRKSAVNYAKKWAFDRNPNYYNFDKIGGDCTNFASQCLFNGSFIMNYTNTFGWYYNSINDRSPSWTDVDYFYNFITKNTSIGPFGIETSFDKLEIGDFIQLGNNENNFYHNLIITGFNNGIPLVSAHTNDAFDRPVTTYSFDKYRFLHILGVRY